MFCTIKCLIELHNIDCMYQSDQNLWLFIWQYLLSSMGGGFRLRSLGDAYWRWLAAPFALLALVWAGGQSESSRGLAASR